MMDNTKILCHPGLRWWKLDRKHYLLFIPEKIEMRKVNRLTLELIFLCNGTRNTYQIVEIIQSLKTTKGLGADKIKTYVNKKIESFLDDGIACQV